MKRKEYQLAVGREERKRDDHEVAEEGPQQRAKHVTDGRMRTGSRQLRKQQQQVGLKLKVQQLIFL